MRIASFAVLVVLVSVVATARAGHDEPKECVRLARTWDAAVQEAQLRNVPIVVHSHGFYCGPCWGMHSAVMCNKKYIDFADDNTVEVICLQRLKEGIEKKEARAATYEVEVGGKKVEYLVEFPGRTVEEIEALESSKGGQYNQSGSIPYTALVDPHTLKEITHWGGGTSASTIMEAVEELRKSLEKEHGKGVARKDIAAVEEAEVDAQEKIVKGDYAGALKEFDGLSRKADKWPEVLKERWGKGREAVIASAEAELTRIETAKEEDATAARRDLTKLMGKLRGTGLEDRAKALLATF
jgi:hypothetical protein